MKTVVVTGRPQGLEQEQSGVRWVCFPVLEERSLAIDAGDIERLRQQPPDWVIFSSRRGVDFFFQHFQEEISSWTFRTGCIGKATASRALEIFGHVDFVPQGEGLGTESFLLEFSSILQIDGRIRTRVLLPMARHGRELLGQELESLGCTVTRLPLYEVFPKPDLGAEIRRMDWTGVALILFTSPSTLEFWMDAGEIPHGVELGAIGEFTASSVRQHTGREVSVLPGGNFNRITELLETKVEQ